MRKIAAVLFAISALSAIRIDLFGQAELWGTTSYGGPDGAGVIFKTNSDGTGYAVQKSLSIETPGATPFYSRLTEGANGKLYGLTGYGGVNNAGVLFEYNPANGNYSSKFDFDPATSGANPSGSLVMAANGKFYGMTLAGGACNLGVLFEYDPLTANYTKDLDFCFTNGASPFGSLMLAANGKLYGMTPGGGANGFGVLFEYDPSNANFNIKLDFDFIPSGAYPHGNLMQASNGKLYGLTGNGGVFDGGVLFEFDPTSGSYVKKLDFQLTTGGNTPYGDLTQAANGKLYGLTFNGGVNSSGVLFEYDLLNGTYAVKHDFVSGNDGALPYGNSLIKAANGKLYGMTTYGGAHGAGILFEYDPDLDNYINKLDFESNANPYGSLFQASNGKLYGVTTAGGSDGLGLLFEYDPSTGSYVKKVDFGSSINGAAPQASMVQANNGKLYGMTSHGGANGKGVLFEYDLQQSNYVKKFDFSLTSGSYPVGKLTQSQNGNLYGMTSQGGTNNLGVLFEYSPSTGSYTKKLDFDNSTNGGFPNDNGLTEVSGKLYGAVGGGPNGAGVLFEYEIAGGNFTVKLVFESIVNGEKPCGGMVQAPNGKLYSMTHNGGTHNLGVLYEYDPVTGNYVKKMDLDLTTGAYPMGSLVLAANGKLYGATSQGGANNQGTLFEFDPTTGTFSKKLDFPSPISERGDWPLRGLTLAPNRKIYGTTIYGAANDEGALLEYDPSNSDFVKKHDFIAATGSNPYYSSLLVVNANQTISFNALPPKVNGDAPFSLSATASSGLPVSYVSSDNTVATVTGSLVTILKAGATIITASQAGDIDYFPAPDVQQTLTINKASQTITFATLTSMTLGDADFTLTATASAGLPVTYSSGSDKITLNGSGVSMVKAGRVTITANQPGDDSYNAAPSVDQDFCINPPKPTITVSNVANETATLTSSASDGNQWYLNGTAMAGATGPVLIVSVSGTYKVQAKADDCVSEFSGDKPLIITGDISASSNTIEVYPNPVESDLEIRGIKEVSVAQLFDMLGRTSSLELEGRYDGYSAHVQHLTLGVYLLRVQSGSLIHQIRFIKK